MALPCNKNEINAAVIFRRHSFYQLQFFQIINQPGDGSNVTSGFMEVKGMVRAISTKPLMLEVYTDEGILVGTRQATVVTPPDGAYHPFEAIVPYTINQVRGARLIVRQESDKIPGNVALSSVALTIKP